MSEFIKLPLLLVSIIFLGACEEPEDDPDYSPRTVPWTINKYDDTIVDHTITLKTKTNLPLDAVGTVSIGGSKWAIDGAYSVTCLETDFDSVHNTNCDLEVIEDEGKLTFLYQDYSMQEKVNIKEHTSSDIDSITFDIDGFYRRSFYCNNLLESSIRSEKLDRSEKKGIDTYHYYTRELDYQQTVSCNEGRDIKLPIKSAQTSLISVPNPDFTHGTESMQLTVEVNANTVSDIYIRYMDEGYYGFVSYNTPNVITKNGTTTYKFNLNNIWFSSSLVDDRPIKPALRFWPYLDLVVVPKDNVPLDDSDLYIEYGQAFFGLEKSNTAKLQLEQGESYLAIRMEGMASKDGILINSIVDFAKPPTVSQAPKLSASFSFTPKVLNSNLRAPIPLGASSVPNVKAAPLSANRNPNDKLTLNFSENVTLITTNDFAKQQYPANTGAYSDQPADVLDSFSVGWFYTGVKFVAQMSAQIAANFQLIDQMQLPRSASSFILRSEFTLAHDVIGIRGPMHHRLWEPTEGYLLVPPVGKLLSSTQTFEKVREPLEQNLRDTLNGLSAFATPGVITSRLEPKVKRKLTRYELATGVSHNLGNKRLVINNHNKNEEYLYIYEGVYAKSNYRPRIVKTGSASADMECSDKLSYSQHYNYNSKKTVKYLNEFKEIHCAISNFSGEGNLGVALDFDNQEVLSPELVFLVNLPRHEKVVISDAVVSFEGGNVVNTITFNEDIVGGLDRDDFQLSITGDLFVAIDRVEAIGSGIYKIYLTEAQGYGSVRIQFSHDFILSEHESVSGIQFNYEDADNAIFPSSTLGTRPVSAITHKPLDTHSQNGFISGKTLFEFKPSRDVGRLENSQFLVTSDDGVTGRTSSITNNLDGTYSIAVERLKGNGSMRLLVLANEIQDSENKPLGESFYSDPVDVETRAHVVQATIITLM